MIPLELILRIGCVILLSVAIYFSLPDPALPQQPHSSRGHNNGTYNSGAKKQSEPGDKCTLCNQPMTKESMHTLNCGHALCRSPCFQNYRTLCRDCPCCGKIVIRIDAPGDNCCICCEPLTEESIEYLKCEHALHKTCLRECKRNDYKICPVCKRKL